MKQRQTSVAQVGWLFLTVAVTILWAGCGEDSPSIDLLVEPEPEFGSIAGQVIAEGSKIQARVLQDNTLTASAEVNEDGTYRVDELTPGDYTIELVAAGYEQAELVATVLVDEVTQLQSVELQVIQEPLAHVRGLVLDEANAMPLVGFLVQLQAMDDTVRDALTSDAGVFEFQNLPVDQVSTLRVEVENYEVRESKVGPLMSGDTAKVELQLTPVGLEQLPLGQGLHVGTQAPNFTLMDGNGQQHTLDDYTDQKVVVLFYRGGW